MNNFHGQLKWWRLSLNNCAMFLELQMFQLMYWQFGIVMGQFVVISCNLWLQSQLMIPRTYCLRVFLLHYHALLPFLCKVLVRLLLLLSLSFFSLWEREKIREDSPYVLLFHAVLLLHERDPRSPFVKFCFSWESVQF